MSRSFHATYRDLKNKTKEEINQIFDDPDSILSELADKGIAKKEMKQKRKLEKEKTPL